METKHMSIQQKKHSKLFLWIIAALTLLIFFILAGTQFNRKRQAIAALPISSSNTQVFVEPTEMLKNTQFALWPTITPKSLSEPTQTPVHPHYDEIILSTEVVVEQSPGVDPVATQPEQEYPYESDSNPFSIGYSVENRPLEMYHFGTGSDHRLIVAGIHGGYEYNTTNLAFELIEYIQNNPEIIPSSITLFILPSLNPDGLNRSYGYAGRANANNVDLNRNWNLNWKESWNPSGCWAYLEISGGTGPHSEPEIKALDAFIRELEITTLISYHSAALGIFPGDYPNHQPSIQLADQIAASAPYPYPPINTGCEMSGQFVDYTATLGITSLDIELTNHKDSDFEINKSILHTFLNWTDAQ